MRSMRSTHLSTFLVLTAIALIASAHVTVTPRTIGPAGGGDFTIRVPTERPVPTIAVKVEFPPTLRVARLRSKPGWTAETVKDTAGVISAVTWSGGRIPAGEWDEFVVAGRTRDSSGVLVFKAWQTYQGGEVVPWTGEMENRPAPRVTIEPVPAGLAAIPVDRWMSGSALLLGLIALTLSLRTGRKMALVLALAGSAATAEAQASSAADQIAAAVLAAPPELRDDATVLGYLPDGKLAELRKASGDMIPTDEHTPFLMSPGTARAHIMFGTHQH